MHNWGVYMQVTDACNACFEQWQTFTQEVLARVLNQLVCFVEIVLYIWNACSTYLISQDKWCSLQVEQIPPPLLFMRTVLQAIGAFPTLVRSLLILGNVIMLSNTFGCYCEPGFRNPTGSWLFTTYKYSSSFEAPHIYSSKLSHLYFTYFPVNMLPSI